MAGNRRIREQLRALRRERQTGNPARKAESGAAHGAAPAVPMPWSAGFPAASSSSRIRLFQANISTGRISERHCG
jgi:hypothetical protein